MAKGNPQVTARVAQGVVDRLERLVEALRAAAVPGTPEVQLTDAVRAAILAGLPVLEKQLKIKTPLDTKQPPRRR